MVLLNTSRKGTRIGKNKIKELCVSIFVKLVAIKEIR
jgi:hypothetical protein